MSPPAARRRRHSGWQGRRPRTPKLSPPARPFPPRASLARRRAYAKISSTRSERNARRRFLGVLLSGAAEPCAQGATKVIVTESKTSVLMLHPAASRNVPAGFGRLERGGLRRLAPARAIRFRAGFLRTQHRRDLIYGR